MGLVRDTAARAAGLPPAIAVAARRSVVGPPKLDLATGLSRGGDVRRSVRRVVGRAGRHRDLGVGGERGVLWVLLAPAAEPDDESDCRRGRERAAGGVPDASGTSGRGVPALRLL